ncbi:unnamed protein product [Vicia faba]|uniref:AMP-dependent synthetase/ligase domain-containing protein n=1 Tax=Vicia faba TaxID=3906 RepID=A0AAV1AY00_VICFA|nr:unnamed protein product [Vicia faba]
MVRTFIFPIPTLESKLEPVPNMGYDALSSQPCGEICLRGNTLLAGYHKRQDLTEEVMDDGWFHTGDIGEWLPNGAMKIIDIKKDLQINSRRIHCYREYQKQVFAVPSYNFRKSFY